MSKEGNPYFGATFAERKAARLGAEKPKAKAVDAETDEVEDKAVAPKKAAKKSPAQKKS